MVLFRLLFDQIEARLESRDFVLVVDIFLLQVPVLDLISRCLPTAKISKQMHTETLEEHLKDTLKERNLALVSLGHKNSLATVGGALGQPALLLLTDLNLKWIFLWPDCERIHSLTLVEPFNAIPFVTDASSGWEKLGGVDRIPLTEDGPSLKHRKIGEMRPLRDGRGAAGVIREMIERYRSVQSALGASMATHDDLSIAQEVRSLEQVGADESEAARHLRLSVAHDPRVSMMPLYAENVS
ncbi:hypothetical protein FI667_g5226, partial [Globisporangium splendens]